MTWIHYRKLRKHKYQLVRDFKLSMSWKPVRKLATSYAVFHEDGILVIRAGYAWDGPSGPTIDTKSFMRGSLVHDALYQLMREGRLDPSWRKEADKTLRRLCREDGMSWLRAWYVYRSVRAFAGGAIEPERPRPVLMAP